MLNLIVELTVIKLNDIDRKKLSEIVKINLSDDINKYISDISMLLSVIPSRLEHLELEHDEETINSLNAREINEIPLEDLGAQEGRYFVSKRSVS